MPPRKVVAYLVYPGTTLLELDASYGFLRGITTGPWELVTVGASTAPVPTDTPLAVVPQRAFAEATDVEALVVPGASGIAPLLALGDEALMGCVATVGARAAWVASFGTGSLLLAGAGLLAGRRATTHWAYARLLRALGAEHVPERLVEDGRFLTAAGGAGAIDATLHLLARIAGRARARLVQLFGEYDPAPPLGPLDAAAKDPGYLAAQVRRAWPELAQALAGRPELLGALRALAAPEGSAA